ncbi:MAG: alpha-L-fucosidase [Oscillospiraceae bacterium]|nr:alpha-L-fucosidase [Oscillospiraceae bacterium]
MKKPVPTEKQLEFMNWELGVFFHFGIRTFNEGHTDWDGVHMDVKTFLPTQLNAEQWIKTAAAGNAKYAVLTAKHHDGFALWPSEFTEYSVKNSPWKNGQGDVVREFTDACRKYSLKAGLYYSPAQFGSRQMQGKEYDDYFINQISELLSNYGKIDYLWFDGCGSEGHSYDEKRIISAIRALQPDILIFNMWDPDTRWVGNEEGFAPLGTSLEENGKLLPFECDCKIRPHNWFFSENDAETLRSLENLEGLYDMSVGRGGNLLINIAPDRRGLIPERDEKRFAEFGERIRKKYSSPIKSDIIRSGDAYNISSTLSVNANTLIISENLKRGECVTDFSVYYNCCGNEILLYVGKTVGHKQIIHFPTVFLEGERKLTLKITGSRGEYEIEDIRVYDLKI